MKPPAREITRRLAVAATVAGLAAGCFEGPRDSEQGGWRVDDSGFRTGARHWYGDEEEERVIRPLQSQARYDLSEGVAIADNVLLFQKENGGWPKNYDMRAILTREQKQAVVAARGAKNTTFDNGATYSHVEFLAAAYSRTRNRRYGDGCLRGIDFMLAAQNPNGGWPQFFPDTSGYRRYITFNDGAMIGVMSVFLRIAQEDTVFAFLDTARVRLVRASLLRGVECILRCQVVQDGVPTAWCQQHDDLDFRPRGARTYEPVALAGVESAQIAAFLMRMDRPGEDVIAAIRQAVEWLERSAIHGIRVESVQAPTVQYPHHSSSRDVVVVEDPNAGPLWARYYEIGTNRPLFCNRDGRIVYSLAEVDRERRTGYAWYSAEPQTVLERYPAWAARETAGPSRD